MVSGANQGLLRCQRAEDGVRGMDLSVRARGQTQRRHAVQALPAPPQAPQKAGRRRFGHIPDRVSIHERPEDVEKREEFGHFEMDLIQNGKDFILTIVERKTRFLLMERLPHGKNADDVARTAVRLLKPYKKHVKSITTDNGGEFAKHKLISKKLKAPVYFADPYSSWQKGTVENTNKLIRQYIPKTMDISQLSFNKLLVIQFKINNRPRKLLFFNTPSFFFYNFAC